MKIAVRGGHCPKATGSRGIIDELTEDRRVKEAVVKYLRQGGADVLDVTPPDSTSNVNSDLAYGVDKANNWGAEQFVSIHFNNAYSSYNGAIGTEVCVHANYDRAQRVVNGLGSLGFRNRGVKSMPRLYEIRHTNMKSMIIEVCFVEATEDVAIYRRLGADAIGKKIAESLLNKSISAPAPEPQPSNGSSYVVKITADVLNVRKSPSTSSSVATTVKRGDTYTIVEESNGWGKLKSGAGWISLQYTEKMTKPEHKIKIKADVLNVRSGPGTRYGVVTQVLNGQVYTIVDTQDGWGKLKSGAGWISLEYTVKC